MAYLQPRWIPHFARIQGASHCNLSVTLLVLWLQLGDMYLGVMDAIYSVSPNTLFLIEGAGQLGYPGEHCIEVYFAAAKCLVPLSDFTSSSGCGCNDPTQA